MSYTYVKARALPKRYAAQWVDVDLSEQIVSKIFSDYTEITLVLKLEDHEVYVDFNQLRAEYASYDNRLRILLISLGNRTLETLTMIPGGKIDYVKYTDAFRVGYQVKLAKRGVVLPEGYPREDMDDLSLSRPKYPTDLGMIHTYCLVSVNGYFHQTDTNGEEAFVVDGGKSVRYKNLGHVGLTSFADIGRLTKRTIDPATILTTDPTLTLKDTLGFQIPDSVDGKSFFLVLGGYLVFPKEGVFWQTGDHSYRLNLKRIPYLERILESRNFIDLSPLGLTKSELNEEMVNIEEVWSDAVIRKYFTLSQSFFVIVDRDKLFTNSVMLRQMLIPGTFTAYQEPTYPLIAGHGRTVEYWKVKEGDHWAVTAMDTWYRNYIFNRQQQSTLKNVTGQLAMDRPFFYSQGLLLEIGAGRDLPIPIYDTDV